MPSEKSTQTELSPVTGLLELLSVEPEDYELAWHELKAQTLVLAAPISMALLNAETLQLREIRQIFNLRKVNFYLFGTERTIPLPGHLQDNVTRMRSISDLNSTASDGLFVQLLIDQLLTNAISEESWQVNSCTLDATASKVPKPAPLEIRHRTPLTYTINNEETTLLLTSIADASLWYDRANPGPVGAHLFVARADRLSPDSIDRALSRLAACMGIAHMQQERREKAAVHGVVTDGETFRFARIDGQGWWMLSRPKEWNGGDEARIYTFFRLLVREAANMISLPGGPGRQMMRRQTREASVSLDQLLKDFGSRDTAERGSIPRSSTWEPVVGEGSVWEASLRASRASTYSMRDRSESIASRHDQRKSMASIREHPVAVRDQEGSVNHQQASTRPSILQDVVN